MWVYMQKGALYDSLKRKVVEPPDVGAEISIQVL